MLLNRLIVILAMSLLAGCATPPEIKQALTEKDRMYQENSRLMEQYRELVSNINERYDLWNRHVMNLATLNVALKWITRDPRAGSDETPEKRAMQAEIDRDDLITGLAVGIPESDSTSKGQVLGKKIIKFINTYRLEGLPERKDSKGVVAFGTGKNGNTMDRLISALPSLVATIEEKIQVDQEDPNQAVDMTPFDQYQHNLARLRRMNQLIRNYLEIDVTVKAEDVQEIAAGVRARR